MAPARSSRWPRAGGRPWRALGIGLLAAGLLGGVGPLTAAPAAADVACPAPHRVVHNATPPTYARTVALTFDDGPSPRWTPQVLDVLRRRGVRATFFLVGANVDAHPWLARRIVAEGHVVGNHTYSHPNLDRISAAARAAEVDRGTHAILAATGVRPCVFRGPYGTHHSAAVKDLVWSRGMNIAGWSHDTKDYTTPLSHSPAFQAGVVSRATTPLAAHPIVLMHDGSPGNYRQNTVDSVDRIVSFYASRGYAFTDPVGRLIQPSAIQARYAQLGGPTSLLGAPVTGEHRTPDGSGAFTHYQGGSLYWSPATGARLVYGEIRGAWAALGWERSALRYPTTDELGTPDRVGRFNHFSHGSIYWTSATGAHEVRGAIRQTWARLGWERSALGYPTTNELGTPDRVGRFNHFSHGSIYWTPATGAHEVRGAIRQTWARLGWERSALGYPVSGERSAGSAGTYNDFTGGSIYWSAGTGAHELRTGIRDAWRAAGGAGSPLGFPTSDEQITADGTWRSNTFQHGVLSWSTATGYVLVFGPLHAAWLAEGAESGPLGRPVQGNHEVPGGSRAVFEAGSISWSSATGETTVTLTSQVPADPPVDPAEAVADP
jgi:peptidoglycan/xylan/chitin deacetylase (PgdA/CDA1 family)